MFDFTIDVITDKGDHREDNEDRFLIKTALVGNNSTGLFAVADGVGGLPYGEVAAQLTIEGLDKWWNEEYPNVYFDNPVKSLSSAIHLIDDGLKKYGEDHNIKFATTLSLFLIHKNKGYVFHVGDTKIIKMNPDGGCVEISISHTKQLEVGGKSYLTECLGNAKKTFKLMQKEIDVKNGQKFFIGSDGAFNKGLMFSLNSMIEKPELCKQVLKFVREQGETDNVTLIYVKIEGENKDDM